jgi:hypothetical protein
MFPHTILTPIMGKWTNFTLQLIKQELFLVNARAVHSTRGGGTNRRLALILMVPKYLAHTGQAFIVPLHLGNRPIHLPPQPVPTTTVTEI